MERRAPNPAETISPDGTFTVIGPALRPLENTPEIVVRTGRHVDVQQLPRTERHVIGDDRPTELVIVIVPPLDLPTRLSQFGTER